MEYYSKAKIICACGAIHETGSTVKEMHIEICSKCHPFYTGVQKLVDAGGRLEKFYQRAEKTKKIKQVSNKQKYKK